MRHDFVTPKFNVLIQENYKKKGYFLPDTFCLFSKYYESFTTETIAVYFYSIQGFGVRESHWDLFANQYLFQKNKACPIVKDRPL